MSEIRIVNRKGGKVLILNGRQFYKIKVYKNCSSFWRCSLYKKEKCRGSVTIDVIIYFEASSDTLTKRLLGRALSSGRADDNEETIKLRLKTFLDNNQQVLDQYPDKLKRINAEASVDEIFAQVESIIDSLVAAN